MRYLGGMPIPHLMPPAKGIDRAPGFTPATHARCKGTRRDGQPCQGWAAANGFCAVHGGLQDKPGRRERGAALGGAKLALAEARAALGGELPAELVTSPAWRKRIPGDVVSTYLRRADLARAYVLRERDGGAAWRAVLARFGEDADGV